MNSTPASLLELLRRPGEGDAWDRFVRLYTPLLFHWARRVGLRREDATDLVQDVLTHLVRKLPEFTYDRHGSFRAWLRTVTLNKWRERARRAGPAAVEAAGALDDLPAPDDRGAFEQREYRRHLVHSALRTLRPEFPDLTWRAFWAYAVDGRPPGEVAKDLGLTLGTVYVAKSRVLARLRRELEGLLD